jgi:hypothetical protein
MESRCEIRRSGILSVANHGGWMEEVDPGSCDVLHTEYTVVLHGGVNM